VRLRALREAPADHDRPFVHAELFAWKDAARGAARPVLVPAGTNELGHFSQRLVAESTVAVTAAWRHGSDSKHLGLSAEQDRAVLKPQSSTAGSRGIAAARGDRNLSAAADDEGQRRAGLSDPRNAEVRPLAGGCRPTLSPAALPVGGQSSHAAAVTGIGIIRQRLEARKGGRVLSRSGCSPTGRALRRRLGSAYPRPGAPMIAAIWSGAPAR
jgi:hypothetical protein